MTFFILTSIVLPLLAIPLILISGGNFRTHRWISLAVSAVVFLFVIGHYLALQFGLVQLPSAISFPWINIGTESAIYTASFYFKLDGLGYSLVLLSAILMPIGILVHWTNDTKSKGFYALYMLLFASIFGCFMAEDLLLFYLFFEFMLLPMYFLIGIWGGARREYAAIKFFIYTLIGSLLILAVFIGLYLSAATVQGGVTVYSFSYDAILSISADSGVWLQPGALSTISLTAFALLGIGFLIKLPAVPFHTWLPDAHVEAPTSISVVLAGILLKVGAFGLIKFGYGLFPQEAQYFSEFIIILAVVSILYAAYNALAAKDFKKMVAYSSVSHMGFVLLGLSSATVIGINGAIFQLFSHGLLSAALFILVGVLYDRTHDRNIGHYSGLSQKMPGYSATAGALFFASMGLPGFSAFIAEFMTFAGAFKSAVDLESYSILYPIVSLGGIILSAGYFIYVFQKIYLGPAGIVNGLSWEALYDINLREKVLLYSLIITSLLLGIFPMLLLDLIKPYSEVLFSFLNNKPG